MHSLCRWCLRSAVGGHDSNFGRSTVSWDVKFQVRDTVTQARHGHLSNVKFTLRNSEYICCCSLAQGNVPPRRSLILSLHCPGRHLRVPASRPLPDSLPRTATGFSRPIGRGPGGVCCRIRALPRLMCAGRAPCSHCFVCEPSAAGLYRMKRGWRSHVADAYL